jgi:hypothetical protein
VDLPERVLDLTDARGELARRLGRLPDGRAQLPDPCVDGGETCRRARTFSRLLLGGLAECGDVGAEGLEVGADLPDAAAAGTSGRGDGEDDNYP